jgi:acetylornithine deacetylase/succinyl-diaminopimelate desuccinylase-like protein
MKRNIEKRTRIERADFLRTILHYNSDTGVFVWIGKQHGGCVAGTTTANGYIRIAIECVGFHAHRLAWIMHYGTIEASAHVDHINGDAKDNRIANLRLVNSKQNQENSRRPKNNTTGFKGVARYRDKYRSYICHNRRQIHLGIYDTAKEAHAAYCDAAKNMLGWEVHRQN